MKNKAPWKDFNGNNIFQGDKLVHPSGQWGVVVFRPDRESPEDRWLVNYGDTFESRLCLQIGDKGMGVVEK